VTPVVPPRFFTGERTLAEIAEIAKTTDAKRAEIRAAKRDMVLSSIDITSLYPNIPLDDALRVIRILLMELPHLYDFGRVEEIVSLLKLVLKTNVVNFKGRLFLQIKGGAMGTPVLVCVAIIYMFFQQRS